MKDKNDNMEIKTLPQERIYPIYKSVEPFMKVKSGYGYLGVLLYDSWEDRVQCHICGEWKKQIGTHVKKHKLNIDEYKKNFGFNKGLSLCSKGTSKKHSDHILNHPEIMRNTIQNKKYNKILSGTLKVTKQRRSNFMKDANLRMSNRNKIGACNEQIKSRYRIIWKMIKKIPSGRDILKYDPSLERLIKTHFGSIIKLREKMNFKRSNMLVVDDAYLIANLRKWVLKHKRIPYVRDINNTTTYRTHFGSWAKAKELAGINYLII